MFFAFFNKYYILLIFRPNAGTGIWVLFLLPTSILIALFKNPQILSHTYKLATIASIGIIITNIILLTQKARFNNLKIGIPHYISIIFMSFLFHVCLHRGNNLLLLNVKSISLILILF